MGKPLKAVRKHGSQLWVVHDSDDRAPESGPQAAQEAIFEQVFSQDEPVTQVCTAAQSIVWEPEQARCEQWCVYDLLHKTRAPLKKCGSIAEAQAVVQKARRQA